MVVSFSATPLPADVPPRVRLDLDSGSDSSPIVGTVITRDGVPVRSQPPVGSRVSVAYDYEAPFGIATTYTAVITTTTATSVRNETWAALTGWATVSGSPAVGSGRLTAGKVSRTLGGAFPAAGRLTITAATGTAGSLQFGPLRFQVYVLTGGAQVVNVSYLDESGTVLAATTLLPYTAGDDVTVVWGGGTVTMTTLTGYSSINATPAAATFDLIADSVLSGFLLESTAGSTVTTLTDTTTLDVDAAWLIHPATPDLSTCIDVGGKRDDGPYVLNGSAQTVTRKAKGTSYSPVGRTRDVFVSEGDRGAGDWSLVIAAPRIVDRDLIVAELRDQTPLLLRVPPGFGWDLPDDFYSIADYTDDRVVDTRTQIRRVLTLPLTPSDSPVVAQAAAWTYGDVLANYSTYAEVLATFPTYLDLLAGPQ